MMLFIGGRAQGKAAYAAAHTGCTPQPCATPEEALNSPAIDQFHLLCRAILEGGGDLSAFVETLVAQNPDTVVVCDEIGLGIVPLDPFERRWREETSRALCRLAEVSQRVERVCCGLGVRLK
ncbi:MAG TPA: bifunctional adenosylcobinamide kinase/adenosylcobinamide-phosphate guanylyltransferase [Candidatus Flavonifractor merdigallinarum]|uniref:Bifunctional adenosylcobinamide kinase/adenosylcobinamide-phosphate guanylyltransferase n=1 Tax=Candidatus Flavonifractor merdigallinarum TaxID=2838589 RepID=A0A9D1YAK5_9FIRM|nr:bifunctional adenosylcobinamide kinase/adenosylcobinamide-phosphate guanylyltransferase [Candidatus Flavonifractor merdigallinarum]